MPPRRTYMMPSRHWRSSLRGAPPLGDGGCFGSSGTATDQSWSLTKKGGHAVLLVSMIPQSAISLYAPSEVLKQLLSARSEAPGGWRFTASAKPQAASPFTVRAIVLKPCPNGLYDNR